MSAVIDLASRQMRVAIDARGGHLVRMRCLRGGTWEDVRFRQDAYRGPAWRVARADGDEHDVELACVSREPLRFEARWDGLTLSLSYRLDDGGLVLGLTVENRGGSPPPRHLGLRLGLDTCMVKFPDWNDIFFPTLLRCERTHFWGYAMTPRGRILGIASPDPIASWRLHYNTPLHRIHSLSLDLVAPGPLPERHPQEGAVPEPGQRRTWTLVLADIPSLEAVKPTLGALAGIPIIECDRYTVAPGEPIACRVMGDAALELRAPDGATRPVRPDQHLLLGDAVGLYTLSAHSPDGKVSEAKLTVRRPWSWYLQRARAEAIRMPQDGTSHTESWYGFFSCFGAQKHFPDAGLDRAAHARFDEVFPLMYDRATWHPLAFENRIQNHSCAAGLLALRYLVTGDVAHLEAAAMLADFLIGKQTPDGAYRNAGIHYTSVIYVAKSIMEVMAAEKLLAATDAVWRARYQRHRESVRRAMDNLVAKLDDIETEGEMTYEDGMIACSGLQLGMFALMQDDAGERQRYLEAARHFMRGHRCLAQLLIPDSRMNGCTLRFWEAQYDVLMSPNMLNSPHGWSAWRLYGLWYVYQLTGEVEHLRQLMNGLGACVQLVDGESGTLRWAFVPDPQVAARSFEEFPGHPGKGRCVARVIGEQYVPMISDWYRATPGVWATGYWGGDARGDGLAAGESWPLQWGSENLRPGPDGFVWGGDGGCCDNDVHEIFKCLEETALTSAYVVEDAQGRLETWNCRLEAGTNGGVVVRPAEACVAKIHFNLRQALAVEIRWGSGAEPVIVAPGLRWRDRT